MNKSKINRLNMNISDKDRERLIWMSEQMEAETTTQVVKDSLRLLEYVLKLRNEGTEFFVKTSDGVEKKIEIFGVTN